MHLNLGTILQASATAHPANTVLKLNDFEMSYADLDRAARGVARGLIERGVRSGDRVALLIPNVPEFTIAYFGILYAGGTVVPINVLAAAPEVRYFIEDSGAALLVVHPLFAESGQKGAAGAGVPCVSSSGDGDTLVAMAQGSGVERLHPTDPTQTAVILYTSGTTGKPKGAELTHSNLFLNCAVVVPRLIPFGPDERMVALATLPLFHSFGQTCIQNACIAMGGMFSLLPRFGPQEAFELIERDRCTVFAGVPTMYFGLLHHEGGERYDVSSLKYCMTGGEEVNLVPAADDRLCPDEAVDAGGVVSVDHDQDERVRHPEGRFSRRTVHRPARGRRCATGLRHTTNVGIGCAPVKASAPRPP